MDAIWLAFFSAQLVFCLYLGHRVARRTGRSRFNWLLVAFLASIPPLIGPALMIVCALWYPPKMSRPPLRGANRSEPDAAHYPDAAGRSDRSRHSDATRDSGGED